MARHKEFDTDRALLAAMTVFWTHGYEGASLARLTSAMGISRTSLYSTFGHKEALFFKALARYDDLQRGFIEEALGQSTAREALHDLLTGSALALTEPDCPRGCLAITSGLALSDEDRAIKEDLTRLRSFNEGRVRQRLLEAQADGDLDPDEDAAHLARFVMNTMSGMAVQATFGASRSDLLRMVDLSLKGLGLGLGLA